jgi:hypothetical protein
VNWEFGLSMDALPERLLSDASDLTASAVDSNAPQLPIWNLEVRGSLHRRDIYDDVR